MAMATKVVVVPRVQLGLQGLKVSAQGLGCMGMSVGYGTAVARDRDGRDSPCGGARRDVSGYRGYVYMGLTRTRLWLER